MAMSKVPVTQSELELPLLWCLAKRGGAIAVGTDEDQLSEIEDELAKLFRVDSDVRSEVYSRGQPKWRNWLQQVRRRLAGKKQLAKGTKGVWSITNAGYDRLIEFLGHGIGSYHASWRALLQNPKNVDEFERSFQNCCGNDRGFEDRMDGFVGTMSYMWKE